MFYIILGILLFFIGFYIGAISGIADCKKRFGIPKGVNSLDDWEAFIDCGTDNA